MSEKELYRQKMQAKLDGWKADLDKLKARTKGESADLGLKMKKQIDTIEKKIEEGEAKLADLAEANEEKWTSIKESMDSLWGSIKSSFDNNI